MVARRLLGLLLVAEGVSTAVWLAQLLPTLGWRDRSSVALMAARAVVGAMQLTSGWWVSTRRPPGAVLARWALVLSAVLTTFEFGARLTPTDLDPTYRWPLVWAYWVYALGAGWYLARAQVTTGVADAQGAAGRPEEPAEPRSLDA